MCYFFVVGRNRRSIRYMISVHSIRFDYDFPHSNNCINAYCILKKILPYFIFVNLSARFFPKSIEGKTTKICVLSAQCNAIEIACDMEGEERRKLFSLL